jgi:hypothetical protein
VKLEHNNPEQVTLQERKRYASLISFEYIKLCR